MRFALDIGGEIEHIRRQVWRSDAVNLSAGQTIARLPSGVTWRPHRSPAVRSPRALKLFYLREARRACCKRRARLSSRSVL